MHKPFDIIFFQQIFSIGNGAKREIRGGCQYLGCQFMRSDLISLNLIWCDHKWMLRHLSKIQGETRFFHDFTEIWGDMKI